MKRKTNNIPDIKYIPPAPELNKPKSTEQATGEILTAIRQFEPEEQNEIVKAILKELAIDRHNSVRQYREAADRAGKNMEVFMYNAIGLEKAMAEANEIKRL